MIGYSNRRTNEAADFKTEDYDCAMQYTAALGICGNATCKTDWYTSKVN